jgi:hypothetical protein
MDTFSQHHIKSPATEPEHALRKSEFDQTVGRLADLTTRANSNLVSAINELAGHKVTLVSVLQIKGERGDFRAINRNGQPTGQVFSNVRILYPCVNHSQSTVPGVEENAIREVTIE